MLRRVLVALLLMLILAAGVAAALTRSHGRGYFGPIFAPDAQSVFTITRDVRARVVGLGYDMWTPPARVWVHRDRFALVRLRLWDGQSSVIREFPPSPLEGQSFSAYHGGIYGDARVHLRWADPAHLEYELAVTRHDSPLSRTFVLRRRWDATSDRFVESGWQEGSAGMGGDEPAQLSGPLEVLAPRGDEGLPCGVVVIDSASHSARALTGEAACRSRYPDGLSPAVLADQSRRADIERAETIRTTYDELVARGLAHGVPDGEARLHAGREMERLGFFPKSPTLVAAAATCDGGLPEFRISDEEFRVGLFQDIAEAIAHPGDEVAKSMGAYVVHRDYDTSRQINAYLADRARRDFLVEAHGRCWRLHLDRHDRQP